MIYLDNGVLQVEILKKGLTFVSLKHVKDNINIITRFEDLAMYDTNAPYLGACIGPLAGRTEDLRYGEGLDMNDINNHLHGGFKGLHNQLFNCRHDSNQAVFTTYLKKVYYKITVTLEGNSCVIHFQATPDSQAVLNLTNHMYFNLLGTRDLNEHEIKVNASSVSYLDTNKRNVGNVQYVDNTVFDLRDYVPIETVLKQEHEQFEITRHVDHAFLGNQVFLRTDKKELCVKATTPAVQLYFSNYFDEGFNAEDGLLAKNHMSVAIEPQYVPNDEEMKRYTKEDPYDEFIVYTVSFNDTQV